MVPTLQLEPPEPYKPTDWGKFINKLVGFEEWVEKNRQNHYKKYHDNKTEGK